MVAQAWRRSWEDQKVMVIFSYVVSWRLAWDLVSRKQEEGLERRSSSSEGLLLLGSTEVLFPEPTSGISRLPVTRTAGCLTPSSSLHRYPHDVPVSTCTYLINKMINKMKF